MKNSTTDNTPVDIVITWVDGSDPEWLKEKQAYSGETQKNYHAASSDSRFRDYDNLQYIFRGIEKFMPWVNKVYFVTWGHMPAWLNTENKKLVIVNHKDFIPGKYRPTFNSNAIELNMHRIPGLSECFLNFNDDMFVIAPTEKSDFFVNGVPRAEAVLNPYVIRPNGIACTETHNMEIINTHFSMKDIKKHIKKWINPIYGKYVARTMMFMRFSSILGIIEPHTQISVLKSTLEKLWDLEYEAMDDTCSNRFRKKADNSIWLTRQWQIMEGNFEPRALTFSKVCILPEGLTAAQNTLKNPGKCHLLCINDSNVAEDVGDFFEIKNIVKHALDELLPEKSGFEI